MIEAQLVVNRLLEKKPKTRQEVQLIKLEVAKEQKFSMVPHGSPHLKPKNNGGLYLAA